MSDNTQAPPPPDPQPTTLRQGFILDEGPCCYQCLVPPESGYSLPWLIEGEHYTCARCKTPFVNVG